MLWQAETGMYFRLATGYLPFAPEGFYDWPIVTSSLQRVALTDVADQWMAFVGAHDVNAVVLADGPQSLPLKQMVAALQVSPLKVGGVLLYRVRPETLAPIRESYLRRYGSAGERHTLQRAADCRPQVPSRRR
jgi:hypothetical protein